MIFLMRIMATQAILLVVSYISIHPHGPFLNLLERKFGSYERGIDVVLGVQYILILFSFCALFWLADISHVN